MAKLAVTTTKLPPDYLNQMFAAAEELAQLRDQINSYKERYGDALQIKVNVEGKLSLGLVVELQALDPA